MILDRLKALRQLMDQHQLDAYIINGTDPHLSEYAPERWKTRSFISGFTGSAGVVVITKDKGGLWTDSRYFLQAENELKDTGIELFKQRVEGTPSITEWLKEVLLEGSCVGLDGTCFSMGEVEQMEADFSAKSITLSIEQDLLETIWVDRPVFPNSQAELVPDEVAGETVENKISQLLATANADYHLVTALDEIAWLLNIRGKDVAFNPVFMSYLLVGENRSTLFVNPEKISNDITNHLQQANVKCLPYNAVFTELKEVVANQSIYIDPAKTNAAVANAIPENCKATMGASKVALLKAQKNATEISGFHKAMEQDGVALSRFLFWLDKNVDSGSISEYDVRLKLKEFREQQPDFKQESFPPIVGYADHGAIVHFSVTEETANKIEPRGMLLFDSGGQYTCGTTDTTRTVAVGKVTDQMKQDFTLVLKGMIGLTNVVFPENTKGFHVDIMARQWLWKEGLNYGHGTGHGVGFYLNVHEGPMSIRQEFNNTPLMEGMVISNEPALYRENEYGIRTENVIYCVEKMQTEYGRFLGFETFTLCPIDKRCIDKELMSADEVTWLNNYHQQVFNKLEKHFEGEELQWLQEATSSL
ncbi:aminopeptidase P family protein [Prolixibacteraceae bacterium JC049]|nr:aminopeptidase P family protein [Prolixibacteraceae bacterium JC049]